MDLINANICTALLPIKMAEEYPFLLSSDALALLSIAVSSIAFAAVRSVNLEKLFRDADLIEEVTLRNDMAILFPLVASIGLLLFFYYFSVLSFISSIMACVMATIGLFLSLFPLVQFAIGVCKTKLTSQGFQLSCCRAAVQVVHAAEVSTLLLSCVLVLLWLFTDYWAVYNLLGLGIIVVGISFLRLPSLRIGCILLCGLFVYDIFWVFFSEHIFGENVMVAVASKPATNPMYSMVKNIGWSKYLSVPSSVELPVKLLWGRHLLGLGDIVVPGLLLTLALKFDVAHLQQCPSTMSLPMLLKNPLRYFHFTSCWIGYTVGLLVAMIFALYFHVAQPALLYLVPGTILPLVFVSYRENTLASLWNGNFDVLVPSGDLPPDKIN